MFCENCGNKVKKVSKFCSSCGAEVNHASEKQKKTPVAVEEKKSSGNKTTLGWVVHIGGFIFKQADFVQNLQKSNPFINHCLHKLLDSGVIERKGTKRLYYYKLKVSK